MGAGGMTLVFKRAALERLANPSEAMAESHTWTEYVGVISDDPPEQLSAFADRLGLDPDFISSTAGQTGGLAVARQRFSTERHVFIGTTSADHRFAQSLGWEYLDVADAADAADWPLKRAASGQSRRSDDQETNSTDE